MADNLTKLIKEHIIKIGFGLLVLIGLAFIAISAYGGKQ